MNAQILNPPRNPRPLSWLTNAAHPPRVRTALSPGAVIQRMTQLLAFKEAEIQESHHRVKNTLQTAAALLSMQARGNPNVEVVSALKLGSDRLGALAAVHELLYQRADYQTIPLRPLLATIARSFAEPAIGRRSRVLLRVSSEDIAMPAEYAIPLALIANEAIGNAYKHAFTGPVGGFVAVSLVTTADGTVLCIADNGQGISAATRQDALGLRIMEAFTTQIEGRLSFSPMNETCGTTVRLWMPAKGA